MSSHIVTPSGAVYKVLDVFRQWLYLVNPIPVIATLGAFAANYLSGDPVWLLLIGPSSGGKTQMLMSLAKDLNVHVASTLTEASLLSGTPKKDRTTDSKGGLLKDIGEFGLILMKDFTSTISMRHEARTAVLAALREIYDGRWIRRVGADGGLTLSWEGKVGFIGGCTEVIDSYHSVMSIMGPRFLFCRLPRADEAVVAAWALNQTGSEARMREDLENAVQSLPVGPNLTPEPLSQESKDRITALAIFTARSRSPVERHGYTREIELIPTSESPGRLAKQLSMLFSGMRAIGTTPEDAWLVVTRVAHDCIPPIRYKVLAILSKGNGEIETNTIAEKIRYPYTTTHRALQDLEAHYVVEKRPGSDGLADYWSLSGWSKAQLAAARNRVPENSGGKL